MVRTKLTVRKSIEKTRKLPAWIVNNKYGNKKTIYNFKIKQTLPVQKIVNITNNEHIAKTINVRGKSNYLRGMNWLIF